MNLDNKTRKELLEMKGEIAKRIQVLDIRSALIENLSEYNGVDHIKLDLSPKTLESVIFEKKSVNAYKNTEKEAKNKKWKVPAFDFDLIKKLDLTGVSFDNCYIQNLDFTGSYGVSINPQNLAFKSLNNAKLKGVTFTGPFDDCDVRHADFSGSKGAVIKPQTVWYKQLQYATLTDVTIKGTFDNCYIYGTNFTGSTGAFITPMTVAQRTLAYATLTDAKVYSLWGNANVNVDITGVNFTGCIGSGGNICIDPQDIRDKSVSHCILDGVTFVGPFDGGDIQGADFRGSVGAKINPQKLLHKDLSNCNLTDTVLIGSLEGLDTKNAILPKNIGEYSENAYEVIKVIKRVLK